MVLEDKNTLAVFARHGSEAVVVAHPSNLKIVTTGDAGVTLLNLGPSSGKQWTAVVSVSIVETDV